MSKDSGAIAPKETFTIAQEVTSTRTIKVFAKMLDMLYAELDASEARVRELQAKIESLTVTDTDNVQNT